MFDLWVVVWELVLFTSHTAKLFYDVIWVLLHWDFEGIIYLNSVFSDVYVTFAIKIKAKIDPYLEYF